MVSSLPPNHQLALARQNRRLFSDHVLDRVAPRDSDRVAALAEADAFLTWLRRRYEREKTSLPDYRERGLEGHWFRPILRRLGHIFAPEPAVPGSAMVPSRPDYVFFPDQASRREAEKAPDRATFAENALAVGEVKRWDTHLGKKPWAGGVGFEDQNPSWQISQLCSSAGVDWGLLSNGRVWRLVHRETAPRLDTYYQVDLVTLMEHGDPEALLYFTLFFRQAAFLPDSQGHVFLQEVRERSRSYARELKEHLRENARRALQRLMKGFLDYAPNRLGREDLEDVYENSLYLLYRLLFILCGESRALLPLHYERYRTKHSLARIREEIVELEAPAPGTTLYWGRLKNLFQIVNGNYPRLNEALGVPRYNGGLFDPEQHSFLEEKAVGDRALVAVIDLLSRRRTPLGFESVDYRTLSAGHVGSIFEGLLSCRPHYARETMVAVADGDGRRWMAEDEAPPSGAVVERREKGEVSLIPSEIDRASRNSGVRNTAVIEAVVERTVGPVLTRAIAQAKPAAGSPPADLEAGRPGQRIVEAILSLKILDPGMGSGRLLVAATDFLARVLTSDPNVRAAEVDEDDLSYWKRRVVERCIHGVDRNPLAVELAKLSLWLSTVAADRPLSFLDHHLVQGDALIGCDVACVGWPPSVILERGARRQMVQQRTGQINMFDHLLSQTLPGVIGQILEITREESKDYDTVQAKQAADRQAKGLRAPFEAVADLSASAYFSNRFARGDYEEALGVISQPDLLLALEPVRRARRMADDRGFLHWELTFPEAFYDERGLPLGDEAGFDAVLSELPWGRVLLHNEAAFLRAAGFQSHSSEGGPASPVFVERGLRLLAEGGQLGLLLPSSALEGVQAGHHGWGLDDGILTEIVDLGEVLKLEGGISACLVTASAGLRTRRSTRPHSPAEEETSDDDLRPGRMPIKASSSTVEEPENSSNNQPSA